MVYGIGDPGLDYGGQIDQECNEKWESIQTDHPVGYSLALSK